MSERDDGGYITYEAYAASSHSLLPRRQVAMDDTFTCSECRQTFEKGWTDLDAAEELEASFGIADTSHCDVVCDDCYREIMGLPPLVTVPLEENGQTSGFGISEI
jgi:hypothetical protein